MYRELAEHYDRIYASKDYEAESARLVEIMTLVKPGAKTLLDVACGTGGHLVHLQERFRCGGIDLNSEMIEVARHKLPDMPLHVADMTDFDLGRKFDVVACLFSAVGHLPDVAKLDAAIGRMAAHLEPGGVLLVEPWIAPEDWVVGQVGMDTFESDEVKIARISVSEPVERGRLVMEYLVGTKFGVQRLRDEHTMSWFTHAEYRSAFELARLTVERDPVGLTGRGLFIGGLAS